MSRVPDLVLDSRLRTRFNGSEAIHSFVEIDGAGRRTDRKEHWKWERGLGRGGFGQIQLERCVTTGTKKDAMRAVKIISKQTNSRMSLDFNRELEAIAKFSHDRVGLIPSK
jgi:Protein tyrosine and serine/threonine kinase